MNTIMKGFDQCIKCTTCTAYCPVLEVNPLFPGPKQAGPDGERFRLKDEVFYDKMLKACLNCKRCEVACPSNVPIGDLILKARLKYNKSIPSLRDMILANTDIMGTVSTKIAPLVNLATGLKPMKIVMDKVLKIDHRRMFPQYSQGTFESWYKKDCPDQNGFEKQISYFHGCYVNYNNPQLGKDLIYVLNKLGVGVNLLNNERCCGVALISNGLVKQATKQAESNVAALRESIVEKGMKVIATSSTCTFTMRDEYEHILNVDNNEVRSGIDLATRFIFNHIEENNIQFKSLNNKKIRAAYHTPCHMSRMGWGIFSIELLKLMPNVDLQILDVNCCGIAGTYGFKKENYETSQAIGSRLFRQIEESGVDFVTSDCETCKWQIEMSTSKECLHPITVVAMALRDGVEVIR